MRQRVRHGVNHRRVNQRLVALNIHDRVAIATLRDFCDAVRTARMIGTGHLDAAEILRDFPDARVVRRHDGFRKRFCLLALLENVLEEWFARDERERLAGKPGGSKARGNDANDFHAPYLAIACRAEASCEGGIETQLAANRQRISPRNVMKAKTAAMHNGIANIKVLMRQV